MARGIRITSLNCIADRLMKRILAIVCVLVLCADALAQDTSYVKPPEPFRRFQIGISFSPDLTYRTLTRNNEYSGTITLLDKRNELETTKFGYTVGMVMGVNLKRGFGIEIGVQYSNKGFGSETTEVRPSFQNNYTYDYRFTSTFEYIDLPVRLTLKSRQKKVRFIASVGLVTNFLLDVTIHESVDYLNGVVDNRTRPDNNNYNKVNLSLMFSMGAEVTLFKGAFIRIEPTYRYGVIPIIEQDLSGYLWNAGINVGVYYSFSMRRAG